MNTDHCGDPTHPEGVDDLDYHLKRGDNLPTPNALYECWVCPALPDGTSVRHRGSPRRRYKWDVHFMLMRHLRAEQGHGRIEEDWNDMSIRQRRAYVDAFGPAAEGLDPKTLKVKARKVNPLIDFGDESGIK